METPCSDSSRTFYSFTEQRKSQVRASLKYTGGCIREAGTQVDASERQVQEMAEAFLQAQDAT